MKGIFTVAMLLGLALIAGCATAPPSDATAIQGTWKGQEVRNGQAVASWLSLVGREWEFRATDGREWDKGIYTLQEGTNPKQLQVVITGSSAAGRVGQTERAIYQLKQETEAAGTLVITANEPGNPQTPAGFGDRRARQIVFTRE